MDDYYQLLEISKTAGEEEINKAHREQLRVWRTRVNLPDLNARQEADQMVKRLEQAKIILTDASKRADYDRQLAAYVEQPDTPREVPTGGSAQELIQEGWQLLERGNIAQALSVATRATQLDGSSPQAWALLAQAKFRWKDFEDAIYEYKRAISFAPHQDRYYFDLGCVYQATRRWGDALQQFQRASQIEPKLTLYQAAIGEVYLGQKKYSEGVDILEKCVRSEPSNTNYRRLLAEGYSEASYQSWTFRNGNYYATEKRHITEAQTYLSRAESLLSNDPDSASLIQEIKQNIENGVKRKFVGNVGNIVIMIIGSFLWSSIIHVFGLGLVLAPPLAVSYYFSCRPLQYAVNRRVFAGDVNLEAKMASAGIVGIGILIIAFPLLIITNFVRNYAGDT